MSKRRWTGWLQKERKYPRVVRDKPDDDKRRDGKRRPSQDTKQEIKR